MTLIAKWYSGILCIPGYWYNYLFLKSSNNLRSGNFTACIIAYSIQSQKFLRRGRINMWNFRVFCIVQSYEMEYNKHSTLYIMLAHLYMHFHGYFISISYAMSKLLFFFLYNLEPKSWHSILKKLYICI